MTAALTHLAMSPAYRQRLGEAGRTRVLQHFFGDAKGEYFRTLYAQVVQKQAASPPRIQERRASV